MRPVWYIGVDGYFFFFLYRYSISRMSEKTIEDINYAIIFLLSIMAIAFDFVIVSFR